MIILGLIYTVIYFLKWWYQFTLVSPKYKRSTFIPKIDTDNHLENFSHFGKCVFIIHWGFDLLFPND